jgi:hypothetical protein
VVLLAYTMAYHTKPAEELAMILIHIVPPAPVAPALPDVRRPGYAFERAGAAAMVHTIRQHRTHRMLLLVATYGTATTRRAA